LSERLPVCTGPDVVRVLRQEGFLLVGQSGSHQKWRHPSGGQVIVPMHGSKPIPKGTLASIIQGSGLAKDLFR
jgi:predicted RNA binding protein YcfA (HicA-like mRNA interferase family)